jgi:FG-GAP-like repeat
VDFLDSTQCVLFADFDNDGDPDMAAATVGALNFYENTGAKFARRLRLPPVLNAYGLAAADYDLDGDMDVYAARYYPSAGEGGELAVPVPQFDANNGGPNFLIRNDGRAGQNWIAFSDATAASGLDVNNRRFSYAAVWDDFNNDGRPDLYVANDFGRNNLYLQEPGADGKPRFRDATESAGLVNGAFGMSASSGDFDRDGWADIHLGAMWSSAGSRITTQQQFRPGESAEVRGRFQRLAQGNLLFRNAAQPAGGFADVSAAAGITVGRWSWASLFADVDNDSWPDLLVANGFVTGERPDDL